MTLHTSRGLTTVALALVLGACGGNSGEEAKQAAADAIDKTETAAEEVVAKTKDATSDAADKTQEMAGETADNLSASADDVSAKAREAGAGAWTSMKSNWSDWSARLQSSFDKLSMDDVIGTKGERAELVELIQQKYELSKDKAEKMLSEWQAKASNEQ